jgi:predicted dehydrogenase
MPTDDLIRVALIGCGSIGSEWDMRKGRQSSPLSHAGALNEHPRAHLVAMCDLDVERARNAAEHWGVQHVYSDPQRLFSEQSIELAVIATSTSSRWQVVEPALASGVKFFIIEKPLASTVKECRRLVAALEAASACALVNFSRNWDSSLLEVKRRILAGEMGEVQRVVGTYGKGIANNGSHLIDLTRLLCSGVPTRARAIGSPLDVHEAKWSMMKDRAWDAQVEMMGADGEIVNLTLLGTDQRDFTCFELRIIGRKAIFDLSMGGRVLRWMSLQNDPNFPCYVVPGTAVELTTGYLEAMRQMVDEGVRLAAGEITESSCDVYSALRTSLAVDAIERSAKSEGNWISL